MKIRCILRHAVACVVVSLMALSAAAQNYPTPKEGDWIARGRKPLLLLGFGLEIIRTLLFAFSASVPILLTAQLLGGISAAAVTVLTILVITDLTRPIQLGARDRRHPDRHRRFDQHHRNWLYFRGPRPLGRFSDPRGRFRWCDRFAVGGNAGDDAGQIS